MKAGQATFISGIVLGAALGFAAGHILLWAPSSTVPPTGTDIAAHPAVSSEPPFFSSPFPIDEPDADDLAFDLTETIDDELSYSDLMPLQSGTVFAEAQLPGPAEHGIDEPQTLPPSPASPLTTRSDAANERRLQELLDSELSGATDEERAIWIDVLRDLPAEDALGVLQMWKKFGANEMPERLTFPTTPEIPEPVTDVLAPIPPELPVPQLIDNEHTPDRSASVHMPAALSNATIQRLQRARQIVLNNLANAYVWGFRRQNPFLTQAVPSTAATDEDSQPATESPRFDFTPGEVIRTGVPLDWAIVDGPAFFEVTDGKTSLYTRCGHFSIDHERRICLETPRGRLQLVPEVTIPPEASWIILTPRGEISAVDEDGAASELAQLEVVTFLNPPGLASRGHGLFAETPLSGRPVRTPPSVPGVMGGEQTGVVRQHSLERSNVDPAREFALLEHIDRLLNMRQPGRLAD